MTKPSFQLFHLTVKGLIFYQNRFLLHQEDNYKCPGSLECPGGRVDIGETVETALFRELREEIGLDLNYTEHTLRLFTINQRDAADYSYDKVTAILELYYIINLPDTVTFKPQALAEVDTLIWVDRQTDLDTYQYEVPSRKAVYRQAQELITDITSVSSYVPSTKRSSRNRPSS